MSTIEPTEEQKQAALDFCAEHGVSWACDDHLARLLAEREAQLREALHTERTVAEKALAARNDMENERDAARRDLARACGYLLAGQKSEMAMKGQLADARARVAELEGANAMLRTLEGRALDQSVDLRALVAELEEERVASIEARRAVDQHRREREAQHLADIKALRPLFERVKEAQFENYEDAYRAIYKCGGYDLVKQADAVFAHYDEMDAPASTEGGEG